MVLTEWLIWYVPAWHDSDMPRTRIHVNISFPNEKDRDEAMRKSRERGRSLSAQIQYYFKGLSHIRLRSDDAGGK